MLKFILCENFLNRKDLEGIKILSATDGFVDSAYGKDLISFPYVLPNIDTTFNNILGNNCTIKKSESGIFRKPYNCLIHFESFFSLNEWCFAYIIEPSTFNIYKHKSGAMTALDNHILPYKNMIEWDYTTNVILKPGDGVFYRPWLFHSFESGLIYYYKIIMS